MTKKDSGIVDIRGKSYRTVALRVMEFREAHPELGLVTKIVSIDSDRVVMHAQVIGWFATGEPKILATGHAEEVRAASSINRTSALENAETSAIGRALASFGYAGTEFASAEELVGALLQEVVVKAESKPARQTTHVEVIGGSHPSTDTVDPARVERAAKANAVLAQAKDLIGANNPEGFLAMVFQLENPATQLRWIESKLTTDQQEWVAKIIDGVDNLS